MLMNHKAKLPLAVLFLASFHLASSAAADCEACIGDSLVELADTLRERSRCWLNEPVMLKFKAIMMGTINEELEKLYKSSNEVVNAECQRQVQLKSCDSIIDDHVGQANCYVDNSKTLVYVYRDQEQCHKKILMPTLSAFIKQLITGVIAGWKEIHTNC